MQNPWLSLPCEQSDDLTLPTDRPYLDAYASTNPKDTHRIHRYLLPEPFFGRFDAPVVLLLQNPGFSEGDIVYQNITEHTTALRRTYAGDQSHFYLDRPSSCNAPGTRWWKKTACAHLLRDAPELKDKLLVLEFFPYHSEAFDHAHIRIPSQQFTFHLLRQAIERNALVVCARMWKPWICAVPELAKHASNGMVIRNKSIHPAITRTNTHRYEDLVANLR